MSFGQGVENTAGPFDKVAEPKSNPLMAEVLNDADNGFKALIGGKATPLEPPKQLEMTPLDYGSFAKGLDQTANVQTPKFDAMMANLSSAPHLDTHAESAPHLDTQAQHAPQLAFSNHNTDFHSLKRSA